MSDVLANRRLFVALELGNRADLSLLGTAGAPSRIDNWILQSYQELGSGYEFSEAEFTVTGQWQEGEESIPWPDHCRRIDSLEFYFQNGTSVKIGWKDIQYIRRYPASASTLPVFNPVLGVGPPSVVAQFGQQIFIRPYADQNLYSWIIDFWQEPFATPGDTPDPTIYTPVGVADIGGSPLLVPNDWLEIIDYGAMIRGHASLGEVDKAGALQKMLYGYTVPTSNKFVPGIIAQKWNRRQAMAPRMDYNIQPRQAKRSYTNTAG